MKQYKPGYLGKVIPADDQNQLTDFVQNKYDSFTEIYDVCKEDSENINDIERVDTPSDDPTELKVRVSANKDAVDNIKERVKEKKNIKVTGNLITATIESE